MSPITSDVLKDIDTHLKDLHDIFTNDVDTMSMQHYNRITLVLIETKVKLEKIEKEYEYLGSKS